MATSILSALPESAFDRQISYLERLVSEVIDANLRFCDCGRVATVTHLCDERAYCLACYHELRAFEFLIFS